MFYELANHSYLYYDKISIGSVSEQERERIKMKTRRLGKTGLKVSEIGFGGEWLERHSMEESVEVIRYAHAKGINILDCWMADPKSRDIIGEGIKPNREQWYIQGHIGSTWKDGQYYRTREMEYVKPAFEDLLRRLQTDYIDLGMIHYVDSEEEWEKIQHSDYLDYVMELKKNGTIRHIGISSHNPKAAVKAAQSGYVEMILFSINPAFDMLPASEDIELPILFPLIVRLGFDPIWFNVVMLLNLELALITPPVGMNLFVLQGISPESKMTQIIKGVVPFGAAMAFEILLLCFFPELATWLPNVVK